MGLISSYVKGAWNSKGKNLPVPSTHKQSAKVMKRSVNEGHIVKNHAGCMQLRGGNEARDEAAVSVTIKAKSHSTRQESEPPA